MAKAPHGPLGPAYGSVGNFTFYELNGQAIVRKKANFIDKPSDPQLLVRSGMKAVMQFFSRIKPFLKTGFINESRGTPQSYFNVATSYNRRYAVKVEGDRFVMDYPAVRLSQGNAAPVKDATAELTSSGLKFRWFADETLDWRSQNDQVMMMAYFPEEESAFYQTSGARRIAGQDLLPLPASVLDKRMELYIAFVADDRLSVSHSVYLGRIN
jgi:hypothetical protein